MSTKAVFARGSANRKPEFQLITILQQSENGLSARKRVAHPAALKHLRSFQAKRASLLEANIACDVVAVDQLDNEVVFDFAKGKSLETQFYEALRVNDLSTVKTLLDQVFAVIDSFPTEEHVPAKNAGFKKIFGDHYNQSVLCVVPACIDLNLDNIIEDNDRLTLIDYEWVFDFPVPKDFIKLRVLQYAFWEARTRILKTNPYQDMVLLCDTFFLPKPIYEAYQPLFEHVSTYLKTDAHFVNFIQFGSSHANLEVDIRSMPASELLEIITPFSVGMPRLIKDAQHWNALVQNQQNVIIAQNGDIQAKQQRIAQLENTITYKLLQRVEIRLRQALRRKR